MPLSESNPREPMKILIIMNILTFLCDFVKIGALLGGAPLALSKIKGFPGYFLNYFLKL